MNSSMAFRKTALGVVPAVMQACLNFSASFFLILHPRTVICSAMYLLFALRFDSVNAMFYLFLWTGNYSPSCSLNCRTTSALSFSHFWTEFLRTSLRVSEVEGSSISRLMSIMTLVRAVRMSHISMRLRLRFIISWFIIFVFPFRPLACPLFPCCDYIITWFNHVFNWQIVQSSIIFLLVLLDVVRGYRRGALPRFRSMPFPSGLVVCRSARGRRR